MAFEIGVVIVIGAVIWWASKRWPMPEQNRSTKWRFVPLGAALVIVLLSFATFGAGLLLAPVALVMTYLAPRRLAPPRGAAYWAGATSSVLLFMLFALTIIMVVYEET